MANTKFAVVYNFLLDNIITDDLYIELTPEDTKKDLQNMLMTAIPSFEFPRQNMYDYTLSKTAVTKEEYDAENDFFIKELDNGDYEIDNSYFNFELTLEEIKILAYIMAQTWLQRQITSVEVTRMKYGGTDFKLSSQANQLSKLQAALKEIKTYDLHMQRLYKRRKTNKDGKYGSNWSAFGESSALV